MTVRTLNYTRRMRLFRQHLDFSIHKTQLAEHAFDAALDLEHYKLPGDSRLFVEAYRQTHWMRFDFGSVGDIRAPKDRRLKIFDTIEGILFRVRVTAVGDRKGLLLAEGDRIPFRAKEDKVRRRIPLLPVDTEDLGDEVCRISYESPGPTLLVNSALGNWRGFALSPVVIGLTYPLILREILVRISHFEDDFDLEDRGDWKTRWCRFAELLPGVGEFPEDPSDRDEWVERAVSAFARRVKTLSKFQLYWKEEGTQ